MLLRFALLEIEISAFSLYVRIGRRELFLCFGLSSVTL